MSPEIIKDELDADNYYTREVYAFYGVSMYMCQCIERGLASMMCAVFPPQDRISNKEMYDEILSSHYEKTLGQLIIKLRKHVNVPETLVVSLGKVLAIRNDLAHNYFFRNASVFMKEEGRLKMLQELKEKLAFLEGVNEEMGTTVSKWLKERGAPGNLLQEEIEKLVSNEAYFQEVMNQGQ